MSPKILLFFFTIRICSCGERRVLPYGTGRVYKLWRPQICPLIPQYRNCVQYQTILYQKGMCCCVYRVSVTICFKFFGIVFRCLRHVYLAHFLVCKLLDQKSNNISGTTACKCLTRFNSSLVRIEGKLQHLMRFQQRNAGVWCSI